MKSNNATPKRLIIFFLVLVMFTAGMWLWWIDGTAPVVSTDTKPIIFVTAAEREWAVSFYKMGADYVVVPRILSGHQVAHLLGPQKLSEIKAGEVKQEHLEELRTKIS